MTGAQKVFYIAALVIVFAGAWGFQRIEGPLMALSLGAVGLFGLFALLV